MRIYSMKAVKKIAKAAHLRRVATNRVRPRLPLDAIRAAAAAFELDSNASRRDMIRSLHSLLTVHYAS